MSTTRRRAGLAIGCALLALGCDGLERYATAPGEVYRGSVVGVVDPSIVRRGFASEATLEMTFDPTLADRFEAPPGVLTTSDGAFTDVALEPIVPLFHDVLSEYEIPAGDRVQNYIFVAHPTEGPLAGREPMIFLSLMGDGSIEARIIAGGGDRDDDFYGLFRLRREPR